MSLFDRWGPLILLVALVLAINVFFSPFGETANPNAEGWVAWWVFGFFHALALLLALLHLMKLKEATKGRAAWGGKRPSQMTPPGLLLAASVLFAGITAIGGHAAEILFWPLLTIILILAALNFSRWRKRILEDDQALKRKSQGN
jgi:hypothetical protein